MAEHCAKRILAQQKGEKAPSPYNVLSKREKIVAGYAGLKKGEYKYDDEIIAEVEQERYRELEEEAKEKNSIKELVERMNRAIDRLEDESDESHMTARSRFSRSTSEESLRLFTNNGVDEGPSSSKCGRRDDSTMGRRFQEKMERSQKIFDLEQHGRQRPNENSGVNLKRSILEQTKGSRTLTPAS